MFGQFSIFMENFYYLRNLSLDFASGTQLFATALEIALPISQIAVIAAEMIEFLRNEAAERRAKTQGRPKKLSQKVDSVSDRNEGTRRS